MILISSTNTNKFSRASFQGQSSYILKTRIEMRLDGRSPGQVQSPAERGPI